MIEVALAVRMVLFGLFVIAGIEKLAHPRGFSETLVGLGVIPGSSTVAARGIGALELCVAFVMISPTGPAAGALTFLVGTVFAASGGVAIRRGLSLSCHCFGARRASPLGWHQMVLLPAWLAAGTILIAWSPQIGADHYLLGGGLVLILILVVRLAGYLRLVREVYSLRLAMGPTGGGD